MSTFLARIVKFLRDRRAGITALSLFLFSASLLMGAFGLDVSHVMMARTKLQVTADAAAHAALVQRELHPDAEAAAKAVLIAEMNMPTGFYGKVALARDVVFGTWDTTHHRFTAKSGAKTAVKVTTRQDEANNNAVKTYLFKLTGLDAWNVETTSVFVTYQPKCLREGFVADGVVDLQSNNNYKNGFCIHSNTHVEFNQNNNFEGGVEVSMPRSGEIIVPGGDFSQNVGLIQALQSKRWNVRVLNRIDMILAGLASMDSNYLRSYITSSVISTLPSDRVDQADLVPGRAYQYNCSKGGTLTIEHDVQVSSVVIVTNCDIMMSNGVAFEDAVIATSSTSTNSVKSTSGVRLGRNDNCATGGGAQLVTAGGVSIPSGLDMFGSQILAKGDVSFAANAYGIQGASIVSAGVISGTSNMNMAFCGKGMDDNFVAEYFRMAQ